MRSTDRLRSASAPATSTGAIGVATTAAGSTIGVTSTTVVGSTAAGVALTADILERGTFPGWRSSKRAATPIVNRTAKPVATGKR